MLGAGSAEQTVLVEEARRLSDGFFFGVTPASGAVVTVSGPAEHRFVEDPGQPGTYRGTFTPQAGARYSLQVQGARGQEIAGEATVPEPFGFRTPSRDTATAPEDSAVLRWSRSPSAAGYILLWRRVDRSGASSANEILQSATPWVNPDTTVAVNVRNAGVLHGLVDTLRFTVAAVDENFRNYVLTEDQVAPDGSRSRFRTTVRGGYGLFGAYAISDSRVIGVRK
jgi:hypothetical protein